MVRDLISKVETSKRTYLAALVRAKLFESVQHVIHEEASLLEVALECAQRPALDTIELAVLSPRRLVESDLLGFVSEVLCDGIVTVYLGTLGCRSVLKVAHCSVSAGLNECANNG